MVSDLFLENYFLNVTALPLMYKAINGEFFIKVQEILNVGHHLIFHFIFYRSRQSKPKLSPSNCLPTYTSSDFTLLRDFLTFELDLVSCQRSGVLANCTVEEVLKAKVRDGKRIIKVANNKTKRSHGPANFCTGKDLHRGTKYSIMDKNINFYIEVFFI